jgi:predicted nucleotidyltransferase
MERFMNPVAERVRMVLEECLGDNLEAAFVYGSVARGTATMSSDLDTFVITCTELDGAQRKSLRSLSVRLQRQLGYQPDEQYPIEIFSMRQCEQALRGPLVTRAIYSAACGNYSIDTMTLEHDDLEVLRALLDTKLLITSSLVLDSLVRLVSQKVTTATARYGTSMEEFVARLRPPTPGAKDAS